MELSIAVGQVLRPVLKVKLMFLEDEILTRINTLEDKDQMELIGLIIPKLSGEDFLEVLSRALNFKDNLYLSKGLLLIELLPYIPSEYFIQVSKEILRCIGVAKKRQQQLDELQLINSFLNQLENQKNNPDLFNFLIEISQELSNFRVGLDFTNRIAMAGRCFKLMHHSNPNKRYPIYEREKAIILQFAKELKVLDNKYLFLLGLLEHYPLVEEERLEIIKLALEALEALRLSLKHHREGNNIKNEHKYKDNISIAANVVAPDKSNNQLDYVPIKEQIKLLYFLEQKEKKQFLLFLYEEIVKDKEPLVQLEHLVYLLAYTCAKKTGGRERNWPLVQAIEKNINKLIDHLYEEEADCDHHYFSLINFLTGPMFNEVYGRMWADVIVKLAQDIKCPSIKANALLLMLEKTKVARLKMFLNIKLSKTIKLIPDKVEELNFRIRNLFHFQKESQQETAAKILAEIALLPSINELVKAGSLVDIVSYLTPAKRKEAFLVANTIENEFARTLATLAFTNYLTKHKKAKVIESGLSMIDRDSSDEQKVLLLKQFIKYSLPDLHNLHNLPDLTDLTDLTNLSE